MRNLEVVAIIEIPLESSTMSELFERFEAFAISSRREATSSGSVMDWVLGTSN